MKLTPEEKAALVVKFKRRMAEAKYRDWRDFASRVCRPWVDSDTDEVPPEFAEVSAFYLATALVMADNALRGGPERMEPPPAL